MSRVASSGGTEFESIQDEMVAALEETTPEAGEESESDEKNDDDEGTADESESTSDKDGQEDDEESEEDKDDDDDEESEEESQSESKKKRPNRVKRVREKMGREIESLRQEIGKRDGQVEEWTELIEGWRADVETLESENKQLKEMLAERGVELDPNMEELRQLRAEKAQREKMSESKSERQKKLQQDQARAEAARISEEIVDAAEEFAVDPQHVVALFKHSRSMGQNVDIKALAKSISTKPPARENKTNTDKVIEQINATKGAPKTIKPGRTTRAKYSGHNVDDMEAWLDSEG